MTELAHDCALLRIPFDPHRLFYGDDPDFEDWLDLLATRVADTKRAINKANG